MPMDAYGHNWRAPKVDVHDFSMIPRADIPRSSFRMQHQHKTTFGASLLIPVYCREILPGDSFNVDMTAFCRLATPLFPIMDNMDLESFFFFVPCRLVWTHWYKFMGEQDNPTDSISFSIPQVVSGAGGFPRFSLFDYFGIPCSGQTAGGNTLSVNVLPLRAYNLIYNQWFRDENLLVSFPVGSASGFGYAAMDDGPDPLSNYTSPYGLATVAKRHDYFTSCLPWQQKGAQGQIPILTTNAPVGTSATATFTGVQSAMQVLSTSGASTVNEPVGISGGLASVYTAGAGTVSSSWYPSNLQALFVGQAGNTINALRLAFQTQRLLERDARGGTRYTEIIRSHFGVLSPDARLMRPEYLGGGRSPVNIAPVPQTTATGLTGGTTPLGTLAAAGTALAKHSFRYSATEHGYILGLVTVRRDQVYQQGLDKMWSRLTRYDIYLPVFAALPEQAVYNREIYSDGSANDGLVFGYQEHWAEYRWKRSYTSGYFNSKSATPLDAWHLAENFTALPALNGSFIIDETNVTLQRALAAGGAAANQQLLADFFFDERCARPMPMYSVPGLADHF